MTQRMIKILPNIAKLALAVLCMVLSMFFYLASINAAMAAPEPVRSVSVTGDNITLGDVFTDITDKADFVLAPAPKPDTVLTWDAQTLNRIAKAFKLPWQASATDQIQIRRLASIVTTDMIKEAIKTSLQDQGLQGQYDLDFVGAEAEIILPHDVEPTVTVEAASLNSARQTFSATLRTADNQIKQFTGVVYPLVDIPVLKVPARRGELITRNMVTTMPVRKDLATDAVVVSADDLINMTPRQVVTAYTPVQVAELSKPTMIERGDLVTMQLNNGSIHLTALAKALESGTKGEIIRLMNMDSKRTLEAQVTGLREATVVN